MKVRITVVEIRITVVESRVTVDLKTTVLLGSTVAYIEIGYCSF